MRRVYLASAILWTAIMGYCLILVPSKAPTAEMTIKLNTLTPIVTTGHLTVMGMDGVIRVLDVQAGDMFVIRSTPE